MEPSHEPDVDFARFLEWQTRTELRRSKRFAESAPRTARLAPKLRSAALVLFSLVAGGGLVSAVQQIQQSREVELLVERNDLQVQLADRRVKIASDALQRETALYSEGFAAIGSLRAARLRMAEQERERDQLLLERAELERSSRPSNRDLWAPLVGSRDFVSESLHIDRQLAATRVAHAQADAERTAQLVDFGAVSQIEMADIRADVERRLAGLQGFENRIKLRAQFLVGDVDRRQLERLATIESARERRETLTAQLVAIRAKLERVRSLESQGRLATGSAELLLEVEGLEVELQLIDLELELTGGLKAADQEDEGSAPTDER